MKLGHGYIEDYYTVLSTFVCVLEIFHKNGKKESKLSFKKWIKWLFLEIDFPFQTAE